MTAHYARLHDSTVRRHWEKARKVNARGEAVTVSPDGPLAEASWAKQRLRRGTQAPPARHRLPDLPDVRDHARVPAATPPATPGGAADHVRRRGPRAAPPRRDEPASPRQPRRDPQRPGGRGLRSRTVNGRRCELITPATS